MPDDDEGPVVATLVHHAVGAKGPTRGAVLYLHGYCDYFFQSSTAAFFSDLGFDFFALDLRKHGRSLLPHQTPNFCRSLVEYDEDLAAAWEQITDHAGHDRVVLCGHSTGGLIGALWAARRAGAGQSGPAAVVLNSPWLDLHGSFLVRTVGMSAVRAWGGRQPLAVLPRGVSGVYGETLHRDHHGEWVFDLAWKPVASFPVRAGWLRAVLAGQRRVKAGIDVAAPVLVLCSTRSLMPDRWSEEAARADTVLDVAQIARWAPQLGTDVTLVRIDGAVHDVFLSATDVREAAYDRVARWLDYALH